MAVKRISPEEAAQLLTQGWKYLDVRSIPEFEQGHPQDAFNVPFMHRTSSGLVLNPDFLAEVESAFAKDDPLVVGCQVGGRSIRAAAQLEQQGFTQLVEMRGGFMGERDRSGRVTYDGWQPRNLPVSTEPAPGHSHADLKAKSATR